MTHTPLAKGYYDEPEYASDHWASKRGYELATVFGSDHKSEMEQADEIAAEFRQLRDTLQAEKDETRIAELEKRIAAPAATGVPSDEALDMLRWIVEAYHPQWHYSMEKTGYECAFCKTMFKTSKDFHDTAAHKLGCQWAQSAAWLEQQGGKANE